MRTPIYFWLLICVIAVTINHTNAEEDFNPLNTIENQYESKHSSGNVNLFWTLNEDGGSLSIAITAPATGWLGIAFSLSGRMRGSHGVIGYFEDKTPNVAEYTLKGHSKRDVVRDEDQFIRKAKLVQLDPRTLLLSYVRDLEHEGDGHDIDPDEVQSLIWAYGDSENPGPHRRLGSAMINFKATNSESDFSLLRLHGILMWIAFGVLFPIGVLLGRFLPKTETKTYWFAIHRFVQSLGGLCMMTAVVLIVIDHFQRRDGHSVMKNHGAFGSAMIAITSVQIILAIFVRPSSDNDWRGLWLLGHLLFGYTIVIGGFISVSFGFNEYLDNVEQMSLISALSYVHLVIIGALSMLFLALTFARQRSNALDPDDGHNQFSP